MEIRRVANPVKKLKMNPAANKNKEKYKASESEMSPDGIGLVGEFILSVSTSKKSFKTRIDAEIKKTDKNPNRVVLIEANFPSANNCPITTQIPAENGSSNRISFR